MFVVWLLSNLLLIPCEFMNLFVSEISVCYSQMLLFKIFINLLPLSFIVSSPKGPIMLSFSFLPVLLFSSANIIDFPFMLIPDLISQRIGP